MRGMISDFVGAYDDLGIHFSHKLVEKLENRKMEK